MTAIEFYAVIHYKRGCGCRHGFCGACAINLPEIKGENELKTCLACRTTAGYGKNVCQASRSLADKRLYNIEDLWAESANASGTLSESLQLYPGCNACTKHVLGLKCNAVHRTCREANLKMCRESFFIAWLWMLFCKMSAGISIRWWVSSGKTSRVNISPRANIWWPWKERNPRR